MQVELVLSDQVTLSTSVQNLIREKDEEIERLKRRVICDSAHQQKLQAKARAALEKWHARVVDEGRTFCKRRALRRMWDTYRKHFGDIRSYRDTPEHRFYEALRWLDAWALPGELIDLGKG